MVFDMLNGHAPDVYDLTQEQSSNCLQNTRSTSSKPKNLRLGTLILKLPRVYTVTFGNKSIYYQSLLCWNQLQGYLPFDNISTLSLGHLKYLAKFYFLSTYSFYNS